MASHESQSLVPRPPVELEIEPFGEPPEPLRGAQPDVVRRYLEIFYRHRWIEAGIVMTALAIAVAWLTAVTPVYQANTVLLIEADNPTVVTFKEVLEQNATAIGYYPAQIGILRSRRLARITLDRLGLWNHPEFTRPTDGLIRRAAAVAGIDLPWPRRDPSADPKAADETVAQSWALDAFLDRLSVGARADNQLVDVRFRSRDAALAANVVNTLAAVYIDDKREQKIRASREASAWLQARLAEQRRQLERSEQALQDYREQNPQVPLAEEQSIAAQKLTDLNSALTKARTERIEAESVYAQLSSIQKDAASYDTLPVVLANPFVQELKKQLAIAQSEQVRLQERLGPEHPDMMKANAQVARLQQQLRAEVAKITDAARNQVIAVTARERSLAAAVDAQQRESVAVGGRSIRYEALQREAASDRQMFDALLQRAREAEVSSEITATNVRVVDSAEVPRTPVYPRTLLVLVLAVFLGVPLAAGTALAREYLNDRIDSPQDITSQLGVRVLGFSPMVPTAIVARSTPIVTDQLSPEFTEAFRAIRANLILSVPPQGRNSLLVTSTMSGEGKTLVACNLAVALARAGRRVLLIDADMRRPQVHRNFKMDLEPGLASVLQDRAAIADVVSSSPIEGLFVVPAGDSPETPGDLLELPVFERALAAVRDHYDWVVIDSPPVMGASDAIALAHVAATVVFVIGAHMVSAREARAALEQLQPSGARIIGAVLSRADLDEDAPYTYARYGYYRRAS